MTKFLCVRWVDATKAQKPYPIAGYSLHSDAASAEAFLHAKKLGHPAWRPALLTEDGKFGARLIVAEEKSELANRFQAAAKKHPKGIWLKIGPKPENHSDDLRALQAYFHAPGKSEDNLPIVLI